MRWPIERGVGRIAYRILPHDLRQALLGFRGRLSQARANKRALGTHFAGADATRYDEQHRYGLEGDYPLGELLASGWIHPCRRLVEVGAGSGYWSARLAPVADGIRAVEPSPDLRRELEARVQGMPVTVSGDRAQRLRSVPDGWADVVAVFHTLHHCDGRPRILREVARVLAPGGRCYLVEPHHNAVRVFRLLWKAWENPAKLAVKPGHGSTHDFVTIGEVRRLARKAGMRVLSLRGYRFPRLGMLGARRWAAEDRLGRIPGVRHFGAVLAAVLEKEARSEAP